MNRYILIRADNKSISPPMTKSEVIKKLRLYDSLGISTYLIYKKNYLNFIDSITS